MANDERKTLDTVIARIGACAKILIPTVAQFADAYIVETKGPTPLDALALSCILDDARTLDKSTERALLALDRKAVSAPVAEDLANAGVKIFGTPDKLAAWLASLGIALTLPSEDADRADVNIRDPGVRTE